MSVASSFGSIIIGALCLSACRTPPAPLGEREQTQTALGRFGVEYQACDAAAARQVELAIAAATPALSGWGKLPDRVSIHVLPSHRDLESVLGWPEESLRAWAVIDEVFLQSPRSWGAAEPPQGDVNELVLHELTHCLMYQLAHAPGNPEREIPLWFREGMAAWTAHQGEEFASLEELAAFYAERSGDDPLESPELPYPKDLRLAYGAAYQAFSFLDQRYGQAAVRDLMRRMASGRSFPAAFQAAIGIEPSAFVHEFRRYAAWRGFRRSP